jgi:hypothetical protein
MKARLSQEDFLVSRSAGAEWSEKRLAHYAASDKSRCFRDASPAGGRCSGDRDQSGRIESLTRAFVKLERVGVSLRHDKL